MFKSSDTAAINTSEGQLNARRNKVCQVHGVETLRHHAFCLRHLSWVLCWVELFHCMAWLGPLWLGLLLHCSLIPLQSGWDYRLVVIVAENLNSWSPHSALTGSAPHLPPRFSQNFPRFFVFFQESSLKNDVNKWYCGSRAPD